VARLNAEVRDILKLPEIRKRLQSDGIEPNDLDAAAYTAFVRDEIARWAPLARAVK
jgi:tripartite-type tricarboxylate transporter receptor subunit TctC